MSRDLRELLHDTASEPTRSLEPSEVVGEGRRRVIGARIATSLVVALVAAVAAISVPPLFDEEVERSPEIADHPPEDGDGVAEDGNEPPSDTDVPDGWRTLTAGGLAVSVPDEWTVDVREPSSDEDVVDEGPCFYDLYGGISFDEMLTDPLAVVYPYVTDNLCYYVGLPDRAPAHPSIVLYGPTREPGSQEPATDEPDRLEAQRVEDEGERDRIGTVDVWRITHDHSTEFITVDWEGGLFVSHVDERLVQEVLATVRPAEATEQEG